MRRWKAWDLTSDVLALYGKKGYDAPLMQRGAGTLRADVFPARGEESLPTTCGAP